MATDDAAGRSLISEVFASGIYKKNQGRLVRQLTCLAIWIALGLGVWRFHDTVVDGMTLPDSLGETGKSVVRLAIPLLILAAGMWISFRVVNWRTFADFLISVQAEMNKVTWPAKPELVKASLVVIFTIAFLAALLFGFDLFWRAIFEFLGIA
jgi:preprotein translocase subunit SecE